MPCFPPSSRRGFLHRYRLRYPRGFCLRLVHLAQCLGEVCMHLAHLYIVLGTEDLEAQLCARRNGKVGLWGRKSAWWISRQCVGSARLGPRLDAVEQFSLKLRSSTPKFLQLSFCASSLVS